MLPRICTRSSLTQRRTAARSGPKCGISRAACAERKVLGTCTGAPSRRPAASRIRDRKKNGHLCPVPDTREASAQCGPLQRDGSIELRRVGQNRAEPYREQGTILMPQFRQNAIVPKQIGDSGPRTSSHVTDDGGNRTQGDRSEPFSRKARDPGPPRAARRERVHAHAHFRRARFWPRRRGSMFLRSSRGSTRSAAHSRTERRA